MRGLARLLHADREEAHCLLGDAVTETSQRVMASVFDGDPQPLYDIVLDLNADQFLRGRICETLPIIVREGLLPKDNALAFLRNAFDKLESDKSAYVWDGWLSSIAMLGLEELAPLAKQVIEENLNNPDCDPLWDNVEDFENAIKYGSENLGHVDHENEDEYALWTDTLGEFATWGGFASQKPEAGRLSPDDWEDDDFPLD